MLKKVIERSAANAAVWSWDTHSSMLRIVAKMDDIPNANNAKMKVAKIANRKEITCQTMDEKPVLNADARLKKLNSSKWKQGNDVIYVKIVLLNTLTIVTLKHFYES